MKKQFTIFILTALIYLPSHAQFSDGSGWAAVTYLIQLVEQGLKDYYQFQQILQTSKDAQAYMKEINRGLDNSIRLLSSLPIKDENILGQLRNFQKSLSEVEKIYGAIPKSPEQERQQLGDLAVAESLKMIANANDYAQQQETNAGLLESRSWDMSPKGAMRMQAQASSQILLTLNQILKMNAQLLKMQSAQFATHNREEKQEVLKFQRFSRDVASSSRSFKGDLTLPRF